MRNLLVIFLLYVNIFAAGATLEQLELVKQAGYDISKIEKSLIDKKNDDFILVMGITIVIAIFFVFINIIVDILYALIDPRVVLK